MCLRNMFRNAYALRIEKLNEINDLQTRGVINCLPPMRPWGNNGAQMNTDENESKALDRGDRWPAQCANFDVLRLTLKRVVRTYGAQLDIAVAGRLAAFESADATRKALARHPQAFTEARKGARDKQRIRASWLCAFLNRQAIAAEQGEPM